MKRIRPLNEEKRKSIVKAAISEFKRVGYDAASMDRISAEANVSKATVYNHFGSKKELFLALMIMLKEIMEKYHYIEYDPTKNIEDQLRQFAMQELEMIGDTHNMTLMRIAVNALMNDCEVTPMLQEMTQDFVFENLANWFKNAKSDGKLDFDDVNFVTQQFIGNIKIFAAYPQLHGASEILPKKEWSKVIESAVKIIMMLYRK